MYEVDFVGYIPEWGTVEIVADSTDEAEELSHNQITNLYPEMVDVEILEVKKINGNARRIL